MSLKKLFSLTVTALAVASLCWALWVLVADVTAPWLGLCLVSGGMLFQQLTGLDRLRVPHHKVRLPMTSLAVLAGLALILLTVEQRGAVLWLGFANVGGFLLDTYWARD